MTSNDPDTYLDLSKDRAEARSGSWFRDIRNAAITLTGWSFGRRGEISRIDMASGRRAFVLIGLALGLVAALAAWIGDSLGVHAFGAAVFATIAVVGLTNAQPEGGVAAAAADLAGATVGSDKRGIVISGSVAAVLLLRVAALTALTPLSTMLAVYTAALILSCSAMALATLAGLESDEEPLFLHEGSGRVWISGFAAILLAIVFLGFWTAFLAAFISLLVGTVVWTCAGMLGIQRNRNLLYVVRVKVELAVLLTVVAAN